MQDELKSLLAEEGNIAWVALPIGRDGNRSTHVFTAKSGMMKDDDGNVLRIQSFAPFNSLIPQKDTSIENHASWINLAKKEIGEGRFSKVVLSRYLNHPRINHEITGLINRLQEKYSSSCIFYLRHVEYGEWIAATPELLFEKNDNSFRTMALAGTQQYTPEIELTWNSKLKEEQQLVVDFIEQELKSNGIDNIEISEAQNHIAGPVVHLKSDIEFQTDINAERVAKILHPTSAVCGMPREISKHFIIEHEKHERRLYTGCFGIQSPNGDATYFVMLRCMQIFSDHYGLYVGGGITASSIPEEEWQETENKSRVMLDVLD